MTRWHPTLGAFSDSGGTRVRVWAPRASTVDLVIESDAAPARRPLAREAAGTWTGLFADLVAGTRYRFALDGGDPMPDPASRFQPEGVHGPSEVIAPGDFAWTDAGWTGPGADGLVFYEVHPGTFTPEGTFEALASRLDALVDLGVTALQLMPLADFPGARNWGYDGVAPFAPARCYGRPDDLRRLVDRAHAAGLAVFFDVVYNHLGPDGAYQWAYSPQYFTDRHRTPWGKAVNLDGEGSAQVRAYFIENALSWIHEFHGDGLRLDATHALADDSPTHFLAELAARVRTSVPGRRVYVVAEDHRNMATMLRPADEGGWGLDAVWADDFHHQVRVALARDHEGYYRDFTGAAGDLAATIRQGWFFVGQFSRHQGHARGTRPDGLLPRQFVVAIQNHDQVGNRAFGERLHHQVDAAAWRAASALLLAAPETPLLFMGQEWAASAPFLYFTDHHEELGRLVTEGRRGEFKHFEAFADPATAARIPDPQAASTFERSRLDWDERERPEHAAVLRLYRALLALRRTLDPVGAGQVAVRAGADRTVVLRRTSQGVPLLVVVHLGEGAEIVEDEAADAWRTVLSTEDAEFSAEPRAVETGPGAGGLRIRFARAGAVVLRRER